MSLHEKVSSFTLLQKVLEYMWKIGFEYLWNKKNKGLNESERKQIWEEYFGNIGTEEVDSTEYMTQKIRGKLRLIISEEVDLFK